MVKKYIFGNPIETEAVVTKMEAIKGDIPFGKIECRDGFSFFYAMDEKDVVYGLGEANRGINKRGYQYVSFCSDDPDHSEGKTSLYGAHNFVIVSGKETFGLFLDYPGKMTFDIGYTISDEMHISCENADLYVYVITGENAYDIVKQFRKIIGRSYIPPRFAFGYGQSRWGYKTREDFKQVVEGYRNNHIPIDMVYMDIDYMENYKDFTVNKENFPDFKSFVDDMKKQHIHLVPIIDAGVKIEDGYEIYEEGIKNHYFCCKEDGEEFAAAVWPGWTHFPDVLNKDAREWFGNKYKVLMDQGIDAFWNDMNEPAIFYTPYQLASVEENVKKFFEGDESVSIFDLKDSVLQLANNQVDYERFYHNMDGRRIRHDKVHNLFGYNMTRAAGEAFERISPDKRVLMFSRSSYIGMHRYGGIWTGDNKSWWQHILLNLKMLPSLNMCGFLYVGADLGGFGENTTRDLLLRWLALGVFTPLMRNHAALGTRPQECYQFEQIEDFAHIIGVRYRLLPYLYSEYMKAALFDDMMFKPLAFTYPKDELAREVEDQIMVGNEIMIAPIYTANATGRYVYLPEEMMFVKFLPDGTISQEVLQKGIAFVKVALNEVPLFIRKGYKIPVAKAAEYVDAIDKEALEYIGYLDAAYELYDDDGITPIEK